MVPCLYHPDRPGIGLCMRCLRVICAECCTRLDGINHCHACLSALAQRAPVRRPANSAVLTAALLALLWLGFFGVFWLTQGRLGP
jgi:hypothetical protein